MTEIPDHLRKRAEMARRKDEDSLPPEPPSDDNPPDSGFGSGLLDLLMGASKPQAGTDSTLSRNSKTPIEPSADNRNAAIQIRGVYISFLEAGFNEEQSMTFTRDLLQRNM